MATVIKILVKFIIPLLIAILFSSCNFDINISGVKGNGNVITQKRLSDVKFTKIDASEGLDVYLTKSISTAVNVQADENIQDLIITEVKNGTLYIHTSSSLGKVHAKKVLVNFTMLNEVNSSSGAEIHTTNFIISDTIEVNASSGSDQDIAIKATNIKCSASSGAEINLSGNTTNIMANASSGAEINAKQLVSEICDSNASSGAEIDLNCNKTITAEASSSADISYSGNPNNVTVSESSSAKITKK
ncbi:MAG: head GIN domain-containing protein [Flavobacteriaceae bacterium]